MLYLLLAIGAAIALSGTALGVRLLRQGIYGRRVPDAAMGIYFILATALGYLPRMIAIAAASESTALKSFLLHLAFVGFILGPVALAVATWATFRPGSPLAATFTALCGVASGLLLFLVLIEFNGEFGQSPLIRSRLAVAMLVMGWTGWEAFSQYRRGCKRVSFGLSNPVVVNRFLLWSISMIGTATLTILRALLAASASADDTALTPVRIAISLGQIVAGAITVTSVALTFYPPTPYRRWLTKTQLGTT